MHTHPPSCFHPLVLGWAIESYVSVEWRVKPSPHPFFHPTGKGGMGTATGFWASVGTVSIFPY
eukprot:scaffold1060_cov385-Pavlova_lutheri.AAC.11